MAISLKLAAAPSDEEVLEISARNPGYQFERSAGGELIVTPTGTEAGRQEGEVFGQLYQWAKADGRGVAFGPSTGFHMPDGALLSPDASWVRRDRWQALTASQQQDYAPLCPDAVFEVASPSDSLAHLRRKMRSYLANGTRLAVLVDPNRRAVEIYVPDRDPKVLDSARAVSLDPVLPGFTLDLEPIFS
ncbi:MAG: Uma2 family endonuclease [bacterium]